MKYTVTVADQTFTVEIDGADVVVDGRPAAAEMHAVPGSPLYQLVRDGRSSTVGLFRQEGGWRVLFGGVLRDVAVVDERTRMLREMTGGGKRELDRTIRAPMPGLVLRVEVEAGQHVLPGTGLVVLEAMKMENEITAHVHGIVKAVHVQDGQTVDKGTPLVELHAEG